jgi:hypothetical protein
LEAAATAALELPFFFDIRSTNKDKIKINAFDNTVEVKSEDPSKYH